MVKGLWGKKIGMTQVFSNDIVVPVTAIDVARWYVTQIKSQERDGYHAIQVGQIKDRYAQQSFSTEWLKKPNTYFAVLREIKVQEPLNDLVVGNVVDFTKFVNLGDLVAVVGTSKGAGFAGVVKRYNFAGGGASHGSTMGRRPGSLSFMRARGRVIKGKRLPGHMGVDRCKVAGLEVVRIESEAQIILVKGSVPGKAGSFVFIEKA